MDEFTFYYEASRRISSNLRIEKALWRCLCYIRKSIPADSLSLHLFDPGLGFIETAVDAVLEGGRILSLKTQLPPVIREQISAFIESLHGKPQCLIIDRVSDDPMAALVARDLGSPEAPCLILDLIIEGQYLGMLSVSNTRGLKYTHEHARLTRLLHDPLAMACAGFRRYRDLEELKERLDDNYRHLQDDLIRARGDAVVGAEQGLKGVMEMVRRVAPAYGPVLLRGETGVGKEVIAHAIHRLSSRREAPLVKMDCAAISETLAESELFGHEKGAFTGAVSRMRGRFERAHQGTLLLDEIGELSLKTQKKILRVLQEGVIERVGGTEPIPVDIRIIAATHRPIGAMVDDGRFRRDLFFRLNVFPIMIPPLRDRREDIPLLVNHFLKKEGRKLALPFISRLAPGAIDRLTAYDWPGNVRELENLLQRELIISGREALTFSSLLSPGTAGAVMPVEQMAAGALSLDRAMSAHIENVLHMTGGRVEGKQGAARLLDIHPRTLQHRMKKLGIRFGRNYRKPMSP